MEDLSNDLFPVFFTKFGDVLFYLSAVSICCHLNTQSAWPASCQNKSADVYNYRDINCKQYDMPAILCLFQVFVLFMDLS